MTSTRCSGDRAPSPFANSFFLTGPTACGKTALGIAVAKELDAEILSLDSMAVYRGMDVGTAKPTLRERDGVPHHMLDLLDPEEQFSVADYTRQAAQVVEDIESRGKLALFVGGTPLYLKTMLFGFFDAPGADEKLRDELKQMGADDPTRVWEELQKVDPVSAQKLHPNDLKRTIRALEIYRLTGKTASEQKTQFSEPPLFEPDRIFILSRNREDLYRRIELRVEIMMVSGFLDETRKLFARVPPPGRTASMAVGYRELKAVLDGVKPEREAVERIKQLTRNFAKRQETWFRSLGALGAERIEADGRTLEELKEELCAKINEKRKTYR